jgi:hypothetical protein
LNLRAGVVFALEAGVTYLRQRFIRMVPDQDTITEVIIVLGMVMVMYFLSDTEKLQSVKQPFSISVSEASPATIHK